MGLTIHYDLRSRTRTEEKARCLVEQMRQMALDLPFEEVGEVIMLDGEQCDVEAQRGKVEDSLLWLLIQSGQSVKCPWNVNISRSVSPTRLIAFHVFPGPGSEPANIGLCQYPKDIDWQYEPADDRKFQEKYHPFGPGSTGWQFSWRKSHSWYRSTTPTPPAPICGQLAGAYWAGRQQHMTTEPMPLPAADVRLLLPIPAGPSLHHQPRQQHHRHPSPAGLPGWWDSWGMLVDFIRPE